MRASSKRPIALGCVVACLSLGLPSITAAQVASDSAARARVPTSDSAAVGYGDSISRSGVDTSRGAPVADTSGRRPAKDSAAAPGTRSEISVPMDSVLAGACAAARPGTVAPGLLLVVFREDATTEERSAALSGVGGSPAGSAPGGGEYVQVPATSSARDVADQLALNPAVASVNERSCPADGHR